MLSKQYGALAQNPNEYSVGPERLAAIAYERIPSRSGGNLVRIRWLPRGFVQIDRKSPQACQGMRCPRHRQRCWLGRAAEARDCDCERAAEMPRRAAFSRTPSWTRCTNWLRSGERAWILARVAGVRKRVDLRYQGVPEAAPAAHAGRSRGCQQSNG